MSSGLFGRYPHRGGIQPEHRTVSVVVCGPCPPLRTPIVCIDEATSSVDAGFRLFFATLPPSIQFMIICVVSAILIIALRRLDLYA